MDNNKVWIVISDLEDDMEIKAAFSSKENAETYIKRNTHPFQNKHDATIEIRSPYLYGCVDIDKDSTINTEHPDIEEWLTTFDAVILEDGEIDLKIKALNVISFDEDIPAYGLVHNRIEIHRISENRISGYIELTSQLNEAFIYNFIKGIIKDCLSDELAEYPSRAVVYDLKISIEYNKENGHSEKMLKTKEEET